MFRGPETVYYFNNSNYLNKNYIIPIVTIIAEFNWL